MNDNNDMLTVRERIEKYCAQLENAINKGLKARGEEKAKATAEYEKAVSIAMLKIISGEPCEIGGVMVNEDKKITQTNAKKIAEGLCHEEKLAMELAVARYTNLKAGIEAIEALLNANQSILRHMD